MADAAARGRELAILNIAAEILRCAKLTGRLAHRSRTTVPYPAPLTDLQLSLDPNELLGSILLNDAHRVDQVNERRSAAVHNRNLFAGELDDQVVDAQPPEGGHQVLYSRHLGALLSNAGGQRRVRNVLRLSANRRRTVQIGPHERDTAVFPGRAKGHPDFLTRVHSDTNRVHGLLYCSLSKHSKRLTFVMRHRNRISISDQ